MTETRAKAAKEQHQLEGALGYAARIVKAVQDGKIKTMEDLSNLITEDTNRINGALSNHCLEALKLAGWTSALFEEKKASD